MSAGDTVLPREDDGLDILGVLEAMLFASTEPLQLEEIKVALPGLDDARLEHALASLAHALEGEGRGLKLEKVAGGFRLVTRPDLAPQLRALFRFRNQKRLTPAALDVLAIVAYAQPVTAPEIQEIRGTDPSYALRTLIDRRLVRMVGRKRVVGRPILYGTTRDFLLHFGLDSLEDLPPVEGFGTRVAPAQGRLFPVTADDMEPLGEEVDLAKELPVPDPAAQGADGAEATLIDAPTADDAEPAVEEDDEDEAEGGEAPEASADGEESPAEEMQETAPASEGAAAEETDADAAAEEAAPAAKDQDRG